VDGKELPVFPYSKGGRALDFRKRCWFFLDKYFSPVIRGILNSKFNIQSSVSYHSEKVSREF
jgi:hypothetical protein